MSIEIGTPALLFPAISLLLLAYTNRYIALASLVRTLHARYLEHNTVQTTEQLRNLAMRIKLIRAMQASGILSLICCVACMFLLFENLQTLGQITFGISLSLMLLSLILSFREVQISYRALRIELSDVAELSEELKKTF